MTNGTSNSYGLMSSTYASIHKTIWWPQMCKQHVHLMCIQINKWLRYKEMSKEINVSSAKNSSYHDDSNEYDKSNNK